MGLGLPLVVFTFVLFSQFILQSEATESPSYESPGFKDWINEGWPFKPLAVAARDAINNNVEIPWSLITYVQRYNLDVGIIAEKVVADQLGLLIPACIGYLVGLLMPLILVLVCCCRSCGFCGGARPTVEDIGKQGRAGLVCNSVVLVAAAGIIIAMAFGVPISGIRMQETTSVVVDSLRYSAQDLPVFVSSFVNESKVVVTDHLNSTIDSIAVQIKDLPNVLSSPLTNSTSGFITEIEVDVDAIQAAMDTLATIEVSTNATVDSVSTHLDDLAASLNELNTNLTFIKNKCVTDGEAFCDTLPDGSAETVDFDTTSLSDMASTISELVNEAKGVNLTGYLAMGNTTFQSIPDIIKNASESTVVDILAALDEVPDTILPEVFSMLDSVSNMSSALGLEEQMEGLEREMDTVDAMIDPFFSLAMQSVGGYLGLIGFTALLGLCLGLVGRSRYPDSVQGRGTATACGAGCLCCSAILAGFVILIILLISSTLLVVGGNLTVFCKSVQEVTIVDEIIETGLLFDGDNLGKMIMNDENFTIPIKEFMDTCRAGGMLLASFNISEMVNITDMMDSSEFVPELDDGMYDSINSTIGDINVYDADFLNDVSSQLEFPSNGSADDIQSMKDEINELDLLQISQNMTDVADLLSDLWYSDYYRSIAATLSVLHYQTKVPLLTSIDDLETNLMDLNTTGNNIKLAIEDLNSTLSGMQSFIQSEAVNVIFESINNFLDSMLEVPTQFVDNIMHTLTTDIGECQIVGDMYDSITGSVCVYFLDSFNMLWLALYVSGLTFVILMLANCLLCKYFRRPKKPKEKMVTFDSTSKMQKMKSYLTIRKSRFSTGSDSPQLLRVSQLKETMKAVKENRDRSAYRARMEFYQSIQPKIEHRTHKESGSTLSVGDENENDRYSVENVCDLRLDLQSLPDGNHQTSFAIHNKVSKNGSPNSGNQIVSHETVKGACCTYQNESFLPSGPDNHADASEDICRFEMSNASDDTFVQIEMIDGGDDDQDIRDSSKDELSSEHSCSETQEDSDMCNIESSCGTQEDSMLPINESKGLTEPLLSDMQETQDNLMIHMAESEGLTEPLLSDKQSTREDLVIHMTQSKETEPLLSNMQRISYSATRGLVNHSDPKSKTPVCIESIAVQTSDQVITNKDQLKNADSLADHLNNIEPDKLITNGNQLEIADSLADHLNDFEAVYEDLTGIRKQAENRKKVDSKLKHTNKENSSRISSEVLNIQVQPYSERVTETVTDISNDDNGVNFKLLHKTKELVGKTNESAVNSQYAFSIKTDTKTKELEGKTKESALNSQYAISLKSDTKAKGLVSKTNESITNNQHALRVRTDTKTMQLVGKTNDSAVNYQSALSVKTDTKRHNVDNEESDEWYFQLSDSTFQQLNYQRFALKHRATRSRDDQAGNSVTNTALFLSRNSGQKQSSVCHGSQTDAATNQSSCITVEESTNHDTTDSLGQKENCISLSSENHGQTEDSTSINSQKDLVSEISSCLTVAECTGHDSAGSHEQIVSRVSQSSQTYMVAGKSSCISAECTEHDSAESHEQIKIQAHASQSTQTDLVADANNMQHALQSSKTCLPQSKAVLRKADGTLIGYNGPTESSVFPSRLTDSATSTRGSDVLEDGPDHGLVGYHRPKGSSLYPSRKTDFATSTRGSDGVEDCTDHSLVGYQRPKESSLLPSGLTEGYRRPRESNLFQHSYQRPKESSLLQSSPTEEYQRPKGGSLFHSSPTDRYQRPKERCLLPSSLTEGYQRPKESSLFQGSRIEGYQRPRESSLLQSTLTERYHEPRESSLFQRSLKDPVADKSCITVANNTDPNGVVYLPQRLSVLASKALLGRALSRVIPTEASINKSTNADSTKLVHETNLVRESKVSAVNNQYALAVKPDSKLLTIGNELANTGNRQFGDSPYQPLHYQHLTVEPRTTKTSAVSAAYRGQEVRYKSWSKNSGGDVRVPQRSAVSGPQTGVLGVPQSLAVMASKALLSGALTRVVPTRDSVLQYRSVSAEKSGSKLTYM